jgi:hypothetical protein
VDIERVVQLLRALATAAGDGDDGLVLQQVCDQAVDALGVTGAGVMVMLQGEHHEVLCASDARIAVIEELQDTSGTGPCLDAYRSGVEVSEADLASDGEARWPGFGARAAAEGIRAVFSFPLNAGDIQLGALDLYADQPGALTAQQATDAAVLADVVSHLITAGRPPAETSVPLGLQARRARIEQAKGIASAQLDVSIDDALVAMRRYARDRVLTLTEVAQGLLDRTITLR